VLRAKKFVTEFDASGHLAKLFGHSGAEIKRTISSGAPQMSTSNELVATFGAGGDWETLDETGNVHFQQADHQATAERAKMVNKTGDLTLDGSPVLFDLTSRTTARSVAINQKSGEIQATGGVASTYFSSEGNAAVNLGSGPAHIPPLPWWLRTPQATRFIPATPESGRVNLFWTPIRSKCGATKRNWWPRET